MPKQNKFDITVYRPYVIDFVWKLEVPAKTLDEALSKAADIQNDENATYPKEWVVKSGFEGGADDEMPHLHEHPSWEVIDKDGNDDLSIKKDTSGQRSFVWSADYRNVAHIKPADNACIPHIGHNQFGVLIAEPVGRDVALPEMPSISSKDLACGVVGQQFFCKSYNGVYRILWAFANPQ